MKDVIFACVVCLAFVTAACGDDANSKSATNNPVNISANDTANGQTGDNSQTGNNGSVETRNVRVECSEELARLEGCGIATSEEREILEGMLCSSTDYTDGQVATVVDCLNQWECGGAEPACLSNTNPEPQCSASTLCADGFTCESGVCQPTEGGGGGGACFAVTYSSGSVGDGTQQKRTGDECFMSGECLSERCVTAKKTNQGDLDESQSWCGNKGDCRNPRNADEECPSGFSCQEVPNDFENTQVRWLCVKDSVGPYCS